MVGLGELGGCTTGYPPRHPPGPIFNIFRVQGPTYGQMKAFFQYIDEVSEIGSRKGLELTSFDPRIDPRIDPPDWSRDVPR